MRMAGTAVTCASTRPLPEQGLRAIDRCLEEVHERGVRSPGADADRAYVYARSGTLWIYFTHGDSGTFGKRSGDYRILLTCAVATRSGPSVVFLGETMQEPIVDAPGRSAFVTAEGTTELMFERVQGTFRFCCSQPFDPANVERP